LDTAIAREFGAIIGAIIFRLRLFDYSD